MDWLPIIGLVTGRALDESQMDMDLHYYKTCSSEKGQ